MQINPRYLVNASASKSVTNSRVNFLTQVMLGTKVISSQPVNAVKATVRSPAMAEVDQLLREVGSYLNQG